MLGQCQGLMHRASIRNFSPTAGSKAISCAISAMAIWRLCLLARRALPLTRPVRLSNQSSGQPVLLACDTTQGACSVALRKNGEIISDLQVMTRGHAEALMPMIERQCEQAQIPMSQLQRLDVTHGPGTFTGVRVCLSAMRGLALALKVPLCAIGTLHAMAAAAVPSDQKLIVAVDARRDTFYTQVFDGQN